MAAPVELSVGSSAGDVCSPLAATLMGLTGVVGVCGTATLLAALKP